MAGKISQYPNAETVLSDGDLIDVSVDIGGGNFESRKMTQTNLRATLGVSGTAGYLPRYSNDGTKLVQSLIFEDNANSNIAIGAAGDVAGALFGLISTTKAFGLPGMTSGQRTAISGLRAGLQVYDSSTQSLWFTDNLNAWKEVATIGNINFAGSLGDTPSNYVGHANKILKVENGESAVEFGSWQLIGNNLVPVTTGSEIGSASKRISTIYMSSTIDFNSALEFVNSSTTRFKFTTTGDLAINHSSPSAKLHIVGDGTTISTFMAKLQNSTNSKYFHFRDDGVLVYSNDINLNAVDSGAKVLIGHATAVAGSRGVAIGYAATANGNQSTALGYAPTASGAYDIAIGYVTASGGSAIAIGAFGSATADGAISIGWYAGAGITTFGTRSITLGYTANNVTSGTIGNSSIAIGYGSLSSGYESVAIGYLTSATASKSMMIGQGYDSGATYIVNNLANSIGFGNNSDVPTMIITGGNGTTGSRGIVGIGIGATTPSGALHVKGTTEDDTAYALWVVGSSGNSIIKGRNDQRVCIGGSSFNTALTIAGSMDIDASGAYHLGNPTTDGSWRIIRSGDDLKMEQRESGSWVTKQTISGA